MKNDSEIMIYQNSDGKISLDVRLEDETVWLTQAHMALLFGKGRSTITEHIANVLKRASWLKRWCVGISDIPLSTVL